MKISESIIGKPKKLSDPDVFHKMALIPVLAWVGLGADGLSSSSYGPEEAYRALGHFTYLAPLLGIATMLTVFLISYSYSKIIEHFPAGGGGYVVASHLLGAPAGVVSGSALIVDYILTVTVSVVSCMDATFPFIPGIPFGLKPIVACFVILFLIILNIRGAKESIAILSPIFILFILTHGVMLSFGIFGHLDLFKNMTFEMTQNLSTDYNKLGLFPLVGIFLYAFSIGGGTYTGIEAVSNGIQIIKEPKVGMGKRTMLYMALSLAITSSLIFISYSLLHVIPVEGKTLNAIVAEKVFLGWPYGKVLVLLTLISEGALLIIAAQAGFLDGPRVMAAMAVDKRFPLGFSSLSERLTMKNGIIFMGLSAMIITLATRGNISTLIVMYSINVFVTFSMSQFAMMRFYIINRKEMNSWKKGLIIHFIAFIVCFTILCITTYNKLFEGGWITLVVTLSLIIFSFFVHKHYKFVSTKIKTLDVNIPNLSNQIISKVLPARNEATMVLFVTSYSGVGVTTFTRIMETYKGIYRNVVFIAVALVDSGSFKGIKEIDHLKKEVTEDISKYITLANMYGLAAECIVEVDIDVASTALRIYKKVKTEYRVISAYSAQINFYGETFFHRLVHNDQALTLHRHFGEEKIFVQLVPTRISLA